MLLQENTNYGRLDTSRTSWFFRIALTAFAYVISGKLGLLLAIPPGYATAVWPPSGFALASLMIWGKSIWPGVLLGSFVLNAWVSYGNGASLDLAGAIFPFALACGASFQAFTGLWLLRSCSDEAGSYSLDDKGSVVRFVLLGGLASCLTNSINAAFWLWYLDLVPFTQLFSTWWTWWIGDAIGVIIFVPITLAFSSSTQQVWNRRRTTVALPLALAFSVVVAIFIWSSNNERKRIETEFKALASTLDQSFRNQLANSSESLASIRDLAALCDPITNSQFALFSNTFLKRNPHAVALAWAERVPHEQRSDFEAKAHVITERVGNGPRVPAAIRSEYFPIRYSEPMPQNKAVLGYDLYSESTRLACMSAAAKSGQLTASGRIYLVQDTVPQPSIQFALPVYRAGVNMDSSESREAYLRGFVTTVLRINDFMSGAVSLEGLDVNIELMDSSASPSDQILFNSASTTGDGSKPLGLFNFTNALNIGGRTWEFRIFPTNNFLLARGSSNAWFVLAGGLILASLLGAFLLVLTGRTAKVEVMVAERTATLKSSEARLRSYFDLGLIGMAITSPSKGWIDVNERLCSDLGYSREELMRRTWVEVTHPDDLEMDVAQFKRVLAGEFDGYDMDKRFYRKDGSIMHAAISVHCVRKEDGEIDYFVAMAQDISERQRVREALLKAKEAAEAASRAKGDFLATMSHEIRTPMNGVIGFTELLLFTQLTNEQCSYVKAIKNSGHVLLALINDILDFSKIEAGKMETESTDFEFEAIINEVYNLLGAQAQEKGLALKVQIDSAAPKFVKADPFRSRQVLFNLLGNAIKFTKQGGITLRIESAQAKPSGAPFLRVSVIDTGIGISASNQAELFQKFTQADSSTTRRFGGTGLGLAICKRLVELMGGEIGLQSIDGKGSTFWFTLPVSQKKTDQLYAGKIRRASSSDTGTAQFVGINNNILLAEDNPINQTLARKMLEKLGCRVDLAINGFEAVNKVRTNKYDLVFMDCRMPEMDGYSATCQIRQWEREGNHPHTPIIALTANAFKDDEDECLASGMDAFLSKPVTLDSIRQTLDRWIILDEAPSKT